jgi:hypothetical protein
LESDQLYGGSLYSMTDPFYMPMLISNLGSDYVVWDKAAHIRFRKPDPTLVWQGELNLPSTVSTLSLVSNVKPDSSLLDCNTEPVANHELGPLKIAF